MKEKLCDLLKAVIDDLFDRDDLIPEIVKTKSEVHGDWSSNVAMILAKELQKNPKELAKKIISSLPDKEWIERVELAGPGFINFFIHPTFFNTTLMGCTLGTLQTSVSPGLSTVTVTKSETLLTFLSGSDNNLSVFRLAFIWL